jgi:hypothetical protein
MLELPHTAVGLLIATKIPNPFIAIPLAFASHFLVDLIPHWNPSLYTETKKHGKPLKKTTYIIIADVILSLALGFFLIFKSQGSLVYSLTLLFSAFAAVLPDVIEGFYFYLGVKSKWLMKLIKFQHDHQARASIIPGTITQIIVILLCLFLLFN